MRQITTKPELLYYVITYFAIMILVGAYFSKKIKSSDDYALAGRSLGPIVLMGTLMATSVGSGTVTGGGNSLAYNYGYWAGVMWIVPYLVVCPTYYFIYKIIRKTGCYTVPQILGNTYGHETKLLGSIINLIGLAGIISYQYRGLGFVLNITTGIPVETATIVSAAVVIVISIFGGLFSVAYTDALGAFIIVFCCLIGLPFVIEAGGGWEKITAAVDPVKLTFTGGRQWFTIIGGYLPLIILLLGDQNFYQRISAAKSDSIARNSTIGWAVLTNLAIPCVAIIAFTGLSMFGSNIQAGMAFMSMTTVVPTVIGGLLLAAASAFIVTTGTSYLLSSATSITYDFYVTYINKQPTDKQTLTVTRWATPIIGVVAYVILQFFPTILAVQNWSYTMIGASITPVVLGALLWKKVTRIAGFLSMFVGVSATLIWELLKLPGGVASALIAFPAAVIVLIAATLVTQPRNSGVAD